MSDADWKTIAESYLALILECEGTMFLPEPPGMRLRSLDGKELSGSDTSGLYKLAADILEGQPKNKQSDLQARLRTKARRLRLG